MKRLRSPFLESVLTDLRQECVPFFFHGFELLVPQPLLSDLCATLDDSRWHAHNAFLRRYVAGFGVFRFHFTFFAQPASPWIFLNESEPVPAADSLLYYALRRAVMVRYQRLGVRGHILNSSIRSARAERLANQLLQRRNP